MNSLDTWLQAIVNGIALGWLYVLMALGLTLILSIMGILQLAHGEIYMLGAFATYYFVGKGLGLYPAIAVGMVVMAVFGILWSEACSGLGPDVIRFSVRSSYPLG